MSNVIRQNISRYRPEGYAGRGDKYLADHALELRRLLAKTQQSSGHEESRLPNDQLTELSVLLVEWGEDLHNDVGLWRSLELLNQLCFGHPLPVTSRLTSNQELRGFDPQRIQHFLWGVWQYLRPDILMSPTHDDLRRLAETTSQCLTERFAQQPRDSGIKKFLVTSNQYAWNINTKLLWLGTSSYLFRLFFRAFVQKRGKFEPGMTDQFNRLECTPWSGLGPIDILAEALDISPAERAELHSWHGQHTAPYRVLARHDNAGQTDTLDVRNVVNGQPYTIRLNMASADCSFQPNQIVFGHLIPWNGEWYWMGEQRAWKDLPPEADADFRADMLQQHREAASRYTPEAADQTRQLLQERRANFIACFGNDLVVFPDGQATADAMQKRVNEEWQATHPEPVTPVPVGDSPAPESAAQAPPGNAASPAETGAHSTPAAAPAAPAPTVQFSKEFLACAQGIGVFYNPDEGEEFMPDFHPLQAAFKKQGADLTEEELGRIRQFVEIAVISPAFVLRLVQDHGSASIGAAYMIDDYQEKSDLPYLLHCHKGQFYRKRSLNALTTESVACTTRSVELHSAFRGDL